MGEPSSFNYNTDDFVEIEDKMFETERLAQINECQEKLFGIEKPKWEYLNVEIQNKIMEHYIDINSDFKKAVENYMKL